MDDLDNQFGGLETCGHGVEGENTALSEKYGKGRQARA